MMTASALPRAGLRCLGRNLDDRRLGVEAFDLEAGDALVIGGDVFQFLLAWTNDWASAEDLSQEAFLRLWRSRAKIDWGEPIMPWLIVTGRRLANDRYRKIARRLGGLPSPASFDETQQVRWLDVQSALKDLSALERSTVVLVTFQGMSTVEVARLLDTTPGGVRAALSRGREKLGDAR